MDRNSDRAYQAALLLDFALFVERCFRHLNPGVPFVPGWHIDLLATWLSACDTDSQRIIVNLPPRHLKSLVGSVALPAWLLGHNPSMQIICASYGSELSEKFSRECRSVMESPWYKKLFPKTVLSRARNTELTTTAHGCRYATSVEGPLTGRGADLIIIDDPMKPDEALSDAIRSKVNAWFDNTLYSRLNNKETGSILVIMQRLHEDDLTGHLMGRGPWDHLVLPAIAEQDGSFQYDVLGQQRVYRRKAGEALHPARESLATLTAIRQTMGEYNFAGQYQQAPAPREGGMVKRAWFKTYGPTERPERFDLILQSWDTADKPTELADYSVCTTWGLAGANVYLLHVLRKKLNYPDLKRRVREQADLHRAEVVLIEDKASGTQLIQELSQEGMHSVKAYQPKPSMTKQMRMDAQTGVIENGFVFVPTEAEWRDSYLHEMTIFPAGKHDDQVDSTAQALHWIKMGRKPPPGLLVYYQRELQKQGMPLPSLRGLT